ncbi:MAG: tRNA dimethylallyltransferase [Thermoanaerobacterales bacterium 50_218]|nr:MAG: tRNA dimethylallyltransferase [Thermoanaerobacterales bacterium 50_218]HAA89930.1 tRNA (adenosine(37)-N6)-dimethylallyltransferase MiaA [Peptococcaceae bacterium]
MISLVVVVGPTAVGKSEVAVELALRLNGEIISADSIQVYKYFKIGAAKLSPEEQKGVPHHLFDFLEPDQDFSVAQFQRLARAKIEEIHKRGKLPFLVGGTGLYIQAVIDPYEFPDTGDVTKIRGELWKMVEAGKGGELYKKLRKVDPVTAARLHPNDYRRITRALEVYYLTGKPISSFQKVSQKGSQLYKLAMVGLIRSREELYQRIEARVEKMFQQGLVEEVRNLLRMGYSPELKPFQALGYKQVLGYLRGEYEFQTAIELTKKATRNYAKRQLTWFKRDPRIQWFYLEGKQVRKETLEEIINYICRVIPVFEEY